MNALSETFVITPTGDLVEVNNFDLAVDTLDLSGFIRSDVSEALSSASGTNNAVLSFFDGTVLAVNGENVSGETISDAKFLVSGSNQSPQGNLTIGGNAEVGSTLILNFGAIFDRDGIRENSIVIQWSRDGVPIDGATGSEYTLTDEDYGTVVTATLSYLDFFGRNEQVTSSEFPFGVEPNEGGDSANNGSDAPVSPDSEDIRSIADGVNDTPVTATVFQDIFTIRGGISYIDGREGLDTAVFTGNLGHYTIIETENGAIVIDERTDGHGQVTLENVEFIRFENPDSNGTSFVTLPISPEPESVTGEFEENQSEAIVEISNLNLSIESVENLISLYTAYFNRIPDAASVAHWGKIHAEGASLQEISGMFGDLPEAQALYPADYNPAKLIFDVYENTLGRVPDWASFSFWLKALRSGEVEQDQLVYEVLAQVETDLEDGSARSLIDQQIADRQYIDMKADLGYQFAVEHGLMNLEAAEYVLALFDGSAESFSIASAAIESFHSETVPLELEETSMPFVGINADSNLF